MDDAKEVDRVMDQPFMQATTSQVSPSPSNRSVHSYSDHFEMTICIGKCTQQFASEDLQLLTYFEALFSSRWRYQDDERQKDMIVIGDNKSLAFSVDELSCIIHIKKFNRIPPTFNHKRLIPLCNAADFFSEDILNEELLINFMKKCKPSLSFKVLNDMTKWTMSNESNINNTLVATAAVKYLRKVQANVSGMKRKWLQRYRVLPIRYDPYRIINNLNIRCIFE